MPALRDDARRAMRASRGKTPGSSRDRAEADRLRSIVYAAMQICSGVTVDDVWNQGPRAHPENSDPDSEPARPTGRRARASTPGRNDSGDRADDAERRVPVF